MHKHFLTENERLDPPDDEVADDEQEQIEQARADEFDRIQEDIRRQFEEIARSQK